MLVETLPFEDLENHERVFLSWQSWKEAFRQSGIEQGYIRWVVEARLSWVEAGCRAKGSAQWDESAAMSRSRLHGPYGDMVRDDTTQRDEGKSPGLGMYCIRQLRRGLGKLLRNSGFPSLPSTESKKDVSRTT
jgi:hypothetical protein